MLVSSKWQAMWMESQYSTKSIVQPKNILEDLRANCNSSNKAIQLEALKCWGIWINNQNPDDWKLNTVCYTAIRPLVTKKLQPLHKDADIYKVKLNLMWGLITKVQNIIQLEGPQYILEVFLQSCFTWLSSDGLDNEISSLVFQLLLGLFRKDEGINGCDTENFQLLSVDLFECKKVFHSFADKLLSIFTCWRKVRDRKTVLKFWKSFLEHCEHSYENIPTQIWHKIFKIVGKICTEENEPVKERLGFLHGCATSLKSVLCSSKFIDHGNLLTTPCEALLKNLMELCSVECEDGLSLEMFVLSKETCLVLCDKNIAIGGYDLCITVVDLLEEFCGKSLLWGVWCGLVQSFQMKFSGTDRSQLSKTQMKFYRKLRGVAANFELDKDYLHEDCLAEIRKFIDVLNIRWPCASCGAKNQPLEKSVSPEPMEIGDSCEEINAGLALVPAKPYGSFSAILFNKSPQRKPIPVLNIDLIKNILKSVNMYQSKFLFEGTFSFRFINFSRSNGLIKKPFQIDVTVGSDKIIAECKKIKEVPVICYEPSKTLVTEEKPTSSEDEIVSTPQTRSKRKAEEEQKKLEGRRKRKSFEVKVQEIVRKNKLRKTEKNTRRKSPILVHKKMKKIKVEIEEKDSRKLRNSKEEKRNSSGKLENYFKVITRKSAEGVKDCTPVVKKRKKTEIGCSSTEKGESGWKQTSLKTMMNERCEAEKLKQGSKPRKAEEKLKEKHIMEGKDLTKLSPFKEVFHDHEYAKMEPLFRSVVSDECKSRVEATSSPKTKAGKEVQSKEYLSPRPKRLKQSEASVTEPKKVKLAPKSKVTESAQTPEMKKAKESIVEVKGKALSDPDESAKPEPPETRMSRKLKPELKCVQEAEVISSGVKESEIPSGEPEMKKIVVKETEAPQPVKAIETRLSRKLKEEPEVGSKGITRAEIPKPVENSKEVANIEIKPVERRLSRRLKGMELFEELELKGKQTEEVKATEVPVKSSEKPNISEDSSKDKTPTGKISTGKKDQKVSGEPEATRTTKKTPETRFLRKTRETEVVEPETKDGSTPEVNTDPKQAAGVKYSLRPKASDEHKQEQTPKVTDPNILEIKVSCETEDASTKPKPPGTRYSRKLKEVESGSKLSEDVTAKNIPTSKPEVKESECSDKKPKPPETRLSRKLKEEKSVEVKPESNAAPEIQLSQQSKEAMTEEAKENQDINLLKEAPQPETIVTTKQKEAQYNLKLPETRFLRKLKLESSEIMNEVQTMEEKEPETKDAQPESKSPKIRIPETRFLRKLNLQPAEVKPSEVPEVKEPEAVDVNPVTEVTLSTKPKDPQPDTPKVPETRFLRKLNLAAVETKPDEVPPPEVKEPDAVNVRTTVEVPQPVANKEKEMQLDNQKAPETRFLRKLDLQPVEVVPTPEASEATLNEKPETRLSEMQTPETQVSKVSLEKPIEIKNLKEAISVKLSGRETRLSLKMKHEPETELSGESKLEKTTENLKVPESRFLRKLNLQPVEVTPTAEALEPTLNETQNSKSEMPTPEVRSEVPNVGKTAETQASPTVSFKIDKPIEIKNLKEAISLKLNGRQTRLSRKLKPEPETDVAGESKPEVEVKTTRGIKKAPETRLSRKLKEIQSLESNVAPQHVSKEPETKSSEPVASEPEATESRPSTEALDVKLNENKAEVAMEVQMPGEAAIGTELRELKQSIEPEIQSGETISSAVEEPETKPEDALHNEVPRTEVKQSNSETTETLGSIDSNENVQEEVAETGKKIDLEPRILKQKSTTNEPEVLPVDREEKLSSNGVYVSEQLVETTATIEVLDNIINKEENCKTDPEDVVATLEDLTETRGRKRPRMLDSLKPSKKLKLDEGVEEKICEMEVVEKENMETLEETEETKPKSELPRPLNGSISSRALRMIALVPESAKPGQQVHREVPVRTESAKCIKAPNVDRNSRASKMLALLSENVVLGDDDNPETWDVHSKEANCNGKQTIPTTPTTSLKSPNSSKKKKLIRFDDAKNETVLYLTNTPPSQIQKLRRSHLMEMTVL